MKSWTIYTEGNAIHLLIYHENTHRIHFFFLIIFVCQVNYGNFMHGLIKENIQLNRKVLSELSMHEPYSFKALVDVSRNAFPGNKVPKKEGISIVL